MDQRFIDREGITVQADGAAGQAGQFDVHQLARFNRELEPFLLEDVCDELLGIARNRLRLNPVQVGRSHRTAIGEF